MKRLVDVFLAGLGLLLGAPVMALVALAIKLDSPGRVVFAQARVGQHGKTFNVYKFRKFPDTWTDGGPDVTVAGDARMTRLGRFLERSKLDELPQLWNILRGEMSLVGPRPESLRYADLFQGEFRRVLDFLPGIFGPSQVGFRNESRMYPPDRDPEDFYREVLFPRKARLDISYFSRATLLSDLKWIAVGLWISIAGAIHWKRVVGMHGPVLALDLAAIEIAWAVANWIRFAGLPPGHHLHAYLTGAWLFPALLIPIMVVAGCYRHPVRYFAIGDALRLVVVSIAGWGLAYLVLLGFFLRTSSIVLGPLAMVLALMIMGIPRVWYRERWRQLVRQRGSRREIRIAIYGAGRRGDALISLIDQGFPDATVVGFLDDDDSEMRGRIIRGRSVLGAERDLGTVHAVYAIDQIWMTYEPDIHKYRRLKRWCSENGVKLIILPLTEPFINLGFVEPRAAVADAQEQEARPDIGYPRDEITGAGTRT